jgi:starch synthase
VRVTFVTSEVRPFSQTGGLADVSEALPAALAALGCDMTVVSPLYRSAVRELATAGLTVDVDAAPSLSIGGRAQPLRYRNVRRNGCRFVFVEHDGYYDRPSLYVDSRGADYADNLARYAFLCRAAVSYAQREAPDIVHCNDWQTALLPVYARDVAPLAGTRTLLTVHNLAYQGRFTAAELPATGLDASWFRLDGLEFYGGLNLLKGGLLFSHAVTAVSPTYAEEIQTPAAGWGLDGVLRSVRDRVRGILNGIDVERWNPATDPHLAKPFDVNRPAGKGACKHALQRRCGLPVDRDAFLLAAIGRFHWQKGIPLIADAFRLLAPLGVQLILLGSGELAIETQARALAQAYPRQVAVTVGFDEALAHQIEGGADAFLMPSVYEPCGLNQMYSQRYGTVPIVHATGGLKDTVIDYTPARLAAGEASGFRFDTFDAAHLAEAVLRARRLYRAAPRAWRRLMQDCMRLDHSWLRRARAYLALYEELLHG